MDGKCPVILALLSVVFMICFFPPAFACEGGCTGTCASPTMSLPAVPIKAEISTTTLKALLDQDLLIALYSQGTPERSAFCAYVLQTFLHSLGYTKVIFYREGFETWTRAGNPVEATDERWPFRNL